jgi:hypothetical protein
MIWFSLIIPIIAIIILVLKFQHKMHVAEYFIIFFIPLFAIALGKYISISSQTNDKEYLNSYAIKATYYEDWDEWINKTCTETYDCGKDSEGRTKTCTRNYDCSYRDYHPEYYEIEDNVGNRQFISEQEFYNLCKLWNNKSFEDLHRHYHMDDGDAYFTTFDGIFEHIKPLILLHTYENKVQSSRSVFNFREVDTATIKKYQLYKYSIVPIMGTNDIKAIEKLQKYNALYGATKQVHMIILIFDNQPLEAGLLQESFWKGGNKNEFIVCIGTSKNKIKWTKVISWTDVQILKTTVARKIKEMDSLDINKVVDYVAESVKNQFVRKQFADFNYIAVEPTFKAIIITFVITLILTIILCIVVVKNDFD